MRFAWLFPLVKQTTHNSHVFHDSKVIQIVIYLTNQAFMHASDDYPLSQSDCYQVHSLSLAAKDTKIVLSIETFRFHGRHTRPRLLKRTYSGLPLSNSTVLMLQNPKILRFCLFGGTLSRRAERATMASEADRPRSISLLGSFTVAKQWKPSFWIFEGTFSRLTRRA